MLYATGRSARRGESSTASIVAMVAVVVVCFIIIFGSGAFVWDQLSKEPVTQVAQPENGQEPPRSKVGPGPKVGEAAPEIEAEDLDGVKFKLSDYRGKVIVLDFWAGW